MNTYITKQSNYTKFFAIIMMALLFITSLITNPHQADALSCMQSFPMIATVDTITSTGDYAEFTFDDHFLLDPQIFESRTIDPLFQKALIEKYLQNDLPTYEPEYYSYQNGPSEPSLYLPQILKTIAREGDYIITTPPNSTFACGGPGLTSILRPSSSQENGSVALVASNFGDQEFGLIDIGNQSLVTKRHPNNPEQVQIIFNNSTYNLGENESYKVSLQDTFYSITEIGITYFDNEADIWGSKARASVFVFYGSGGGPVIQPPAPETIDRCKINYSQLVRYGRRGNDVKQVQNCLNNLGYNTGTADGIYGPNTYRGITDFQRSVGGIKVDGIVGPVTVAYLNQL